MSKDERPLCYECKEKRLKFDNRTIILHWFNGLPYPYIFSVKDEETNKLLVMERYKANQKETAMKRYDEYE